MRQFLIMPVAASLAMAALALAGCKKETAPAGGEGKSLAEAAHEADALPKPQPGLYRSAMTMVSFEAPGMPPQAVGQMKDMFARRQSGSEYCLTGEDAAKGYEERVKKLSGQPNCAFDHYSAAGGKLDAKLTCNGQQGMKSVMTMQGTMTPTGSDVTMSMDQSGAAMPGGSMKMTMNVKTTRVGDCK